MDAATRIASLRSEADDLRRRLSEAEAALGEACAAAGEVISTDCTAVQRVEEGARDDRGRLEELVRTRTVELAESERQYRELVQNARSAIVRWDTAGQIEFVNEYLEGLFGYEPGELIGQPLTALIAPTLEDGMTAAEFVQAILLDPQAYEKHDNGNVTKDGRLLWMTWTNRVITDEQGDAASIFAIGTDRTAQRAVELELQAHQERVHQLSIELALTERRERRAMSVWLHDDIAQILASVKLMLGAAKNMSSADQVREMLAKVEKVLGDTLEKTRERGLQLDPPSMLLRGLSTAIEWAAEEAHQRDGYEVTVMVEGHVQQLDPDVDMVLFEAVKELLNNAGQHAEATRVSVSVAYGGDRLEISVTDDGTGVDAAAIMASNAKGFGLLKVRERLASIGGHLTVLSAPGRGSRFTLQVPLG